MDVMAPTPFKFFPLSRSYNLLFRVAAATSTPFPMFPPISKFNALIDPLHSTYMYNLLFLDLHPVAN